MKAVYLKAPKEVLIHDIPSPKRKDNEVLLKVMAVGICGSDVGAYRGTNPLVTYPRILGHEIAGEVLEAPQNDKGIKVGDRVVLEPLISCGACYPCGLGRTNCCEKLAVLGVHIDGGMAEQFSHPAHLVHKVPDNIPWEQVPMAEPLTIALHAIHRAELKAKEHVVITGSGPIGLLAAQAAIVYGAVPIVVDPVDERLKLANELGVKNTINPVKENAVERIKEITKGRMAEVALEASGADAAVKASIEYVSYAGRIVLIGWPKGEVPIPTFMITKKELDVRGSRNSSKAFPESIQLIAEGKVNVVPLISKTVSLEDVPQAVIDLSEHPDKYLKITGVSTL